MVSYRRSEIPGAWTSARVNNAVHMRRWFSGERSRPLTIPGRACRRPDLAPHLFGERRLDARFDQDGGAVGAVKERVAEIEQNSPQRWQAELAEQIDHALVGISRFARPLSIPRCHAPGSPPRCIRVIDRPRRLPCRPPGPGW